MIEQTKTVDEAVLYMGVSKRTLRRWAKQGLVRCIEYPKNRYHYNTEDLNKIKEQGV